MKIKVVILERDNYFLNRIVSVFNQKYADKLEVYAITNMESADKCLREVRIDVILASDVFDTDLLRIPKYCGFAYFVESPDFESVRGQRTVCKFQKAEMIYREILGIYAEKVSDKIGLKVTDGHSRMTVFMSPAGGCGTTTAAVAYSICQASRGKRVLYVNFMPYDTSDIYFSGDGQANFSDIIYALKSRKSNLMLKLESVVRRDSTGIFYFKEADMAMDLLSLTEEEKESFLREVRMTGVYDEVVFDSEFCISPTYSRILSSAGTVVLVSDGAEPGNRKMERACQALKMKEKEKNMEFLQRISLIYNKFSSKAGGYAENLDIPCLGGIPRFEQASARQIAVRISDMNVFEKIMVQD